MDYLNARYHYKRALYLAQLAKLLDMNELFDADKGLEYCTQSGDPLKPSLLLYPAGKLNKVQVCIHVIPEEGSFRLSRFRPDKCNVKAAWWTEGKMEGKIVIIIFVYTIYTSPNFCFNWWVREFTMALQTLSSIHGYSNIASSIFSVVCK